MPTEEKPIDYTITTTLVNQGDWVVIAFKDSAEVFGIRKSIKIKGFLDDVAYEGTLLPTGDGGHLMGVKAAVRKKLGKDAGDEVVLRIESYRG